MLPHPIRGFKDKRKAIEEVFEWIKSRDTKHRNDAKRVVMRDFKVNDLDEELDDSDTEKFWNAINQVINTALM